MTLGWEEQRTFRPQRPMPGPPSPGGDGCSTAVGWLLGIAVTVVLVLAIREYRNQPPSQETPEEKTARVEREEKAKVEAAAVEAQGRSQTGFCCLVFLVPLALILPGMIYSVITDPSHAASKAPLASTLIMAAVLAVLATPFTSLALWLLHNEFRWYFLAVPYAFWAYLCLGTAVLCLALGKRKS